MHCYNFEAEGSKKHDLRGQKQAPWFAWITVGNNFLQNSYHWEVGQSSKNSVNSSTSEGECRSNGMMMFLSCLSVITPFDHLVNARITRRRIRGGVPSRWCCKIPHCLHLIHEW